MTPEERAKAENAMLNYIQTHAKELAASIVEDIGQSSWETNILQTAVDSLIGNSDDDDLLDATVEKVTPLLGIRAMFQFHFGERCEYIIIERNLNNVSR